MSSSEESRRKTSSSTCTDEPLIDTSICIPPASSFHDKNSYFQNHNGMPLSTWVHRLKRRGVDNLLHQFESLCEAEMDGRNTITTSAFSQHSECNRYRNILLYDSTRVVLYDQLGHDYIHASYIDGYKQKSAFIICQGPMKETVVDFWRMIWQEKSVLITMLTGIKEEGREKCYVYFPTSSNVDLVSGPFRIRLRQFERRPACDVLLVNILCSLTEESRNVMLLLYLDWPDSKIPTKQDNFINFLLLTRKAQMTMLKRVHPNWSGHPLGPPIVVHCSAGVGRAATFVTIDVCYQLLIDARRANIGAIVRKVRLQRRHAISNPLQFLFIHLVVLKLAKHVGLFSDKMANATPTSIGKSEN